MRTAFVDAPLIMDWEVDFAISEKLGVIDQKLFNGENDDIQYLQLSMNQIRDMNLATPNWVESQTSSDKNEGTVSLFKQRDLILTHKQFIKEPMLEKTLNIFWVQDVFPDLGDGFVEACLKANHNNVEAVISQILEDSLTPSVASLDRRLKKLDIRTSRSSPPPRNPIDETSLKATNGHESMLVRVTTFMMVTSYDIFKNDSVVNIEGHIGKKK